MRSSILLLSTLSCLAPSGLRADESLETVAFDAAIKRALSQNPTMLVAREEIRRAEALVVEARSQSLPTLSLNGAYTRLDSDRVLNGNVILPANQGAANLTLIVPLFAPQRWVQWWHAKDNVKVAEWSALETRRELAISVARTWLSLLSQHHVVEAAQRARDNARAHVDFTHARFQAGYGNKVDEVRAAQQLAQSESQLAQNTASLIRLREALGVLLGVDHATDTLGDVPAPALPPLSQALDEAGYRSDVKLLEARLLAAKHVTRDDWADYVPILAGSLEPFFQTPPTLTVPEWGYQGILGLTWLLYDGGLRYGLARERKALEVEARANLDNQLRQARADVRAAVAALDKAQSGLAAARQAEQLAEEAEKLTDLAYRHGANTNIEVVDAQRVALDAATAAAVAEDTLRQGLLDVLIASGRFPGDGSGPR